MIRKLVKVDVNRVENKGTLLFDRISCICVALGHSYILASTSNLPLSRANLVADKNKASSDDTMECHLLNIPRFCEPQWQQSHHFLVLFSSIANYQLLISSNSGSYTVVVSNRFLACNVPASKIVLI
jgi:hypothetical protein